MSKGIREMTKKTNLFVVLDVGKTISKLSLWDAFGNQIISKTYKNVISKNEHYQMLDTKGIKEWLLQTLKEFAKIGIIEAIIPVAHGAACAILKNGETLFDPIDYEWQIQSEIKVQYEKVRDEFAHNLSPNMENGLNLGAQLFYLKTRFKDKFDEATDIIPWAQYWAFLLSGIAKCEITSFGAHSDLWSLINKSPSKMAYELGFAQKFAPFAKADEVIGIIKPEIAKITGLNNDVKIYAGLHDSNAALLFMRRAKNLQNKSFTIISTGTWFVCMRASLNDESIDLEKLGKTKGVLSNIDIESRPIPTALFMGGREIEILNKDNGFRIDLQENQDSLIEVLPQIIENQSLILPCPIENIGPFAGKKLEILNKKNNKIYFATMISLYIALVIDYALDLIDSPKTIIIEGRFAASKIITKLLASLRPNSQILCPSEDSNISCGALGLMIKDLEQDNSFRKIEKFNFDLKSLKDKWRTLVE